MYFVTAEGERQLKDSETSLSRLEIELLVLVNGVSTVSWICEKIAGTPVVAAMVALQSLLSKKMISRADVPAPGLDSIGVGDFFKTGAYYVPLTRPTPENESEAGEGASYLQKEGYYVRIARRALVQRKPVEGGRFNVVIVEDEPHLARLLRSYFEMEGFEARIAANRAEILDALRRPPVAELILLDVMLPDADGFEILGKLRHHPAFSGSAIVMLTEKATRESVLKGLAGGADGYITKPFEMDVLMKAVSAVLGFPKR